MSKDDELGTLGTLCAAVLAVLMSPLMIVVMLPLMLLRGWTLSILWGWFVVPVFGLPVIGVVQSIGLSLIVGFLWPTNWSKSDNKNVALVYPFLIPVIALVMGWLLQRWM